MHHRSSLLLLSLLFSATAHAQLYKSVGPDGKITYSDTPPPAKATKVEQKTVGTTAATPFPYELAEAARKHPVTLYTTPNCPACDDGRNTLNIRGIPFAEKTVQSNEDIARLKQAGGSKELPFLTIGANKESGYEHDRWNHALSAAGYPSNSHLPRNYRNPAPQPAAPQPAPVATKAAAETPAGKEAATPDSPPAAAGNAPPGFRF